MLRAWALNTKCVSKLTMMWWQCYYGPGLGGLLAGHAFYNRTEAVVAPCDINCSGKLKMKANSSTQQAWV